MFLSLLRNTGIQNQSVLKGWTRSGCCRKRLFSVFSSSTPGATHPALNTVRQYGFIGQREAQRGSNSSLLRSLSTLGSRSYSASNKTLHKTAQALDEQNASPSTETLPPKSVGIWLLMNATLVFAIIVVGGVTRLTESGLSITEWRPITGVLPPLSDAAWAEEFEKYKATPEFKLLNHSIGVDDFKRIFYMEWGHRVLGRILGLAFVGPLIYFAAKRQISRPLALKLGAMSLLIGAQGFLGWYMVKSGLDDALMDTPGAVPRVSQYRLASHLGLAFVLYSYMFSTGMGIVKDWKYATGRAAIPLLASSGVLWSSRALTALVFLTALSGAFVAGLDAGLVYNEFPLMGGRIVPPTDELFSSHYAEGSNSMWRNVFENPTTVQFDHRVLAMTTYTALAASYASFRKSSVVSPITRRALAAAFAMANIQVLLGISTLLYLVPAPLAATHQAGSVALLSAMIHVLVTLRQPSRAAAALRRLYHR